MPFFTKEKAWQAAKLAGKAGLVGTVAMTPGAGGDQAKQLLLGLGAAKIAGGGFVGVKQQAADMAFSACIERAGEDEQQKALCNQIRERVRPQAPPQQLQYGKKKRKSVKKKRTINKRKPASFGRKVYRSKRGKRYNIRVSKITGNRYKYYL